MATAQTSFSVISLGEAARTAAEGGFGLGADADTGRGRVYVRRDLDIGSFGVNAFYQAAPGAILVGEHDEAASGQEELYVVVAGGCTFTVEGDEVDAPQGTALFVRDPAAKRSALSTEEGTIVLVAGGRRGEAYRPGVGEALSPFFRLYRTENYEGALEICREVLETYPDDPLVLYNIACLESRLGHQDEALEPLERSLAASPEFKKIAATDDDLAPLHDDPRFQALVAS